MRPIVKAVSAWFIQPIVRKRMQRSTFYNWKNIRLFLPPGVFHPGYFFSTKYLLEYLLQQPIAGRSILELGAGNGLISIAAAQKSAHVTATDINAKALNALEDNALLNQVHVEVLYSDLFTHIPGRTFDYIIINPPYYPKEPRNDLERAWYCGLDYDYFRRLFTQLPAHLNDDTQVYMVLSEDCNTGHIENLAAMGSLMLTLVKKKRIFWEWNYIYRITRQ